MSNGRVRDGEATKKKIIEKAKRLFAEKGYNGVSIRTLSKACGMSGALILHHFKSKEGIYDAVRLALIEKYIPLVRDLIVDDTNFFEFMEQMLRGSFRFYKENPIAIKMMHWERLNGFNKPWPKAEEFHKMFLERFKKAIENNEVSSDFNPRFFGIMTGGMTHLWWEDRNYIMHDIFGKKVSEEKMSVEDEKYMQHVLYYMKKCLKKD